LKILPIVSRNMNTQLRRGIGNGNYREKEIVSIIPDVSWYDKEEILPEKNTDPDIDLI
jgi:hypothetical protein